MAYTEADEALDEPTRTYFDTVRRSEVHNLKYSKWSLERTTRDWFTAFFFAFGKCKMSSDLKSMMEYVNMKYADEKYDKHGTETDSEPYELYVIRFTLKSLEDLAKMCDGMGASVWEGHYVPVKFWMLACLTREPELVNQVLGVTAKDKKPTVVPMIEVLRKELGLLCRKPFHEFNIKQLIDKFYIKAVDIYACIDLRDGIYGVYQVFNDSTFVASALDNGTGAGGRVVSTSYTSTPAATPRQTQQHQTPYLKTPSSPYFLYSPTIPTVSPTGESFYPFNPYSMTLSATSPSTVFARPPQTAQTEGDGALTPPPTMTAGTQQQQQQQATSGLTLPDFYGMKHTSARTEALFRKRGAISDLALICTLVSYYLHHVHGVDLPGGLKYDNVPVIKTLA